MTAVDLKSPEMASVKPGKPQSTAEPCDRRGEGRMGKVGRMFPEAGEKVVWERDGGGDPEEAVAVDAEAVPMHSRYKSNYNKKNENRGRGLSPSSAEAQHPGRSHLPRDCSPQGQTMNCDLTT